MTEAEQVYRKVIFQKFMATVELEVQTTVGPDQDAEQVQIGIEFDVVSVGNMIISQETVPLLGKKK